MCDWWTVDGHEEDNGVNTWPPRNQLKENRSQWNETGERQMSDSVSYNRMNRSESHLWGLSVKQELLWSENMSPVIEIVINIEINPYLYIRAVYNNNIF